MSKISDLIAKLPCSPEYDSFLDELDAVGWQLVPKEPTDAMIRAGWCDGRSGSIWDIYRHMLDATPSPMTCIHVRPPG